MYHCQYGDIGEDVKQVQIILRQNDYLKNALEIDSIFGPKTKKAVCRFQRDSGLIADGVVGKNTYSALLFTRYPNFELSEFTCKCQGKYCKGIPAVMDDRLLSILQTMRHEVGAPIYIHSGLRCASHNADVKGSTYSMHLIGKAADISSDIPIARLKSIAKKHNVNGGLGLNYSSFVHLDTGRRRSW